MNMDKRLLKSAGILFLICLIWFAWVLIVGRVSLQFLLETLGYSFGYTIALIGKIFIPFLLLSSFILFIIGLFKKN